MTALGHKCEECQGSGMYLESMHPFPAYRGTLYRHPGRLAIKVARAQAHGRKGRFL
jgi:hypothetical protein